MPLPRTLAIMLLVASAGESASDALLDGIDAVFEEARRIEEQAQQAPRPAWLEGEPLTSTQRESIDSVARDAAKIEKDARAGDVTELIDTSDTALAAQGLTAAQGNAAYRIEILVSWALGEKALREIAAEVASYRNAVMIFRGIPKGQRFRDVVKQLHALLAGLDPVPNVTIDPPRFERLGTDRVPAIAVYANGEPIAYARGTYGIRYMLARVTAGARGDLGAVGPTLTVTEPNLIEVMKQRLASLDLSASKERAAERYWDKLRYIDLPQATEPRSRRFDPSVIVTADIKDARGTVIVPVGSRINPLGLVPFHERILVFDAARPEQVMLARELAGRYRDRRLVLIASGLDRAAGWDGYRQLQDGFRAPVYLLNEPIRARFQIERVPALIDAEGKDIVVREIPPRDTE